MTIKQMRLNTAGLAAVPITALSAPLAQANPAPPPNASRAVIWPSALLLLTTWLFMTLVFASFARAQGTDTDFDGIPDTADNCVLTSNQDQHDDDQDLFGDVCDPDLNNDGFVDALDIAEWKRLMGTGDLEPDLSGDGQVDYRDLGLLNAALGGAPGPRGLTPAEIDPPYLVTDSNVQPVVPELEDIGTGPRPLARLEPAPGNGPPLDFIMNEVILLSTNPQDAADLAARRGGSIASQVDLTSKFGPSAPTMYILFVDPTGTDTSNLNADLATLDPRIHGGYSISDTTGAELLAMVIDEQTNYGLDLSINSVLGSDSVARRSINDAAETIGSMDQPGGETYTPNAFEWNSMRVEPDVDPSDFEYPVDTRVAEAWRVLDAAGMLVRRSRAMVWDGGFYPNADFPPFVIEGSARRPNPDPNRCGADSMDPATPQCLAHGTHSVLSGFGLPDNDFGTAGPGGPVSELTLLASPALDVGLMVGFIFDKIPSAISTRPDVINISASFNVDAGWCVLACPPMNAMTSLMSASGILIVASAGNADVDVDKDDEFCLGSLCTSFEGSTTVPCELDGVMCVGATDYESSRKADFSNWGSKYDANSVDIFAPGEAWSVNALNADVNNASPDDDLQIVNGTSFSAPFISGVATLVNAAQPRLNGQRIADCILRNAHHLSFTAQIKKRVNALDAVRCARSGRSHPFVDIPDSLEGREFDAVLDSINVSANADDAEDGDDLTVQWFNSDRVGVIATSAPGETINLLSVGLPVGMHVLTAGVSDSHGFFARDRVRIEITNPPPTVTMLSPPNGTVFYAGQTITLLATSSDPNETPNFGPLEDSQIFWTVDGGPFQTGNNIDVDAGSLSPGGHNLCVRGEDDGGAIDTHCRSINIVPVPFNLDPNVTIGLPVNNSTLNFPGNPITIEINWSADDAEDGQIPLSQTQVLFQTTTSPTPNSGWVDVAGDLTTQTACARFEFVPGSGLICVEYGTRYFMEFNSVPGANTSYAFIRIIASDSEPAPNTGRGEDEARITINQFN